MLTLAIPGHLAACKTLRRLICFLLSRVSKVSIVVIEVLLLPADRDFQAPKSLLVFGVATLDTMQVSVFECENPSRDLV